MIHRAISLCIVNLVFLGTACSKVEPTINQISSNTPPTATVAPTVAAQTSPTSEPTASATVTLTALPPSPTIATPVTISPQDLLEISSENAAQVKRLALLRGHTDRVTTLTFSRDGLYLASSSWDDTIKIWDVWNGLELNTFPMLKADLNSIAFSPIENWLASADTIWDVARMQVIHSLERRSREPGHVSFSPDGFTLAVAIGGLPITLWEVANGRLLRTFAESNTTYTFSIEFSPDGTQIAAGESFGIVRLWDVASGQVIGTFEYSNESDVHDVAFSPDGRFLASAGTDETVRLWDLASGQIVQTLQNRNGMYGVTFSPDGSLIASAVCDRTVKLWDVASGELLKSLPHADELFTVAFSPDGKLLASAGYDDMIYVWGVRK